MADVAVKGTVPGSAPLVYTLADAAEFVPKSIVAKFDGTSATSAFYPTLVLTDASGLEVGRIPTASAVAAGGSAEVSWFPGGLASSTYPETPWASVQTGPPMSIDTTGSANWLDLLSADFYTNTAGIFEHSTYNWGGGTTYYGVCKLLTSGMYLATVNGRWTTIEDTAIGEVNLSSTSLGTVGDPTPGWLYGRQATYGIDPFHGNLNVSVTAIEPFTSWIVYAPDYSIPAVMGLFALQDNATASATLNYGQIFVTRLADAPASFYPQLAPYS